MTIGATGNNVPSPMSTSLRNLYLFLSAILDIWSSGDGGAVGGARRQKEDRDGRRSNSDGGKAIWDALTAGAHNASASPQAEELLFSYITHGEETVFPSAFSQKLFSFLDSNGQLVENNRKIYANRLHTGIHPQSGSRTSPAWSECEVWDEVFHLIDINNDGTITKAEFDSVVLSHSDLNNDGQVTKQEFMTEFLRATQGVCDMNAVRQYSEQLFHLVAQPTQNSVPLASLNNLFDITDANGDGVIFLDEYLLQWSMLVLPTDRPHL